MSSKRRGLKYYSTRVPDGAKPRKICKPRLPKMTVPPPPPEDRRLDGIPPQQQAKAMLLSAPGVLKAKRADDERHRVRKRGPGSR